MREFGKRAHVKVEAREKPRCALETRSEDSGGGEVELEEPRHNGETSSRGVDGRLHVGWYCDNGAGGGRTTTSAKSCVSSCFSSFLEISCFA